MDTQPISPNAEGRAAASEVMTRAWGIYEIGRRDENQDCLFPLPPLPGHSVSSPFYMVCDGVGGAAMGQQASFIVCRTFGEHLANHAFPKPNDLVGIVRQSEQALDHFIEAHPQAEGMATTVTLLVVGHGEALLAHAGDSRIYHLREGRILFRTKDHSLVQGLVDRQILTEEEAARHPHRNVISRALSGSRNPVQLEITTLRDVRPGDHFFLCSDGVLEGLHDHDLEEILGEQGASDENRIERIRRRCLDDSRDNFSAWLVRVRDGHPSPLDKAGGNAVGPGKSSGSTLSFLLTLFLGLLVMIQLALALGWSWPLGQPSRGQMTPGGVTDCTSWPWVSGLTGQDAESLERYPPAWPEAEVKSGNQKAFGH